MIRQKRYRNIFRLLDSIFDKRVSIELLTMLTLSPRIH